jgi:hypothetical protein
MQPYWMPYLGYWQLMNYVDKFVIYDNIEYTKKGYINRNKIIDGHITIPLRKAPDKNFISQRELALEWPCKRDKILRRAQEQYREMPCFSFIDTLAKILYCNERNLFFFIENSLREMKNYLGITTPLVVSSTLDIDHSLRKHHKVNAICETLGATEYINPIGGKALYNQEMISCKLSFLRMAPLNREDIPNDYLSIADICFRTNDNLLGEFTLED